MEYSNELKRILKQRLKKEEEIKDISAEYGIRLETLIEWKKEFDQEVEASKTINELIKEGKYEEAEEIGRREKFKKDAIIQSQMITLAIRKRDYERAEEIGSREEFKDYEPIQSQMIALAIRKRDYERAEEIGSREEFKNYVHIQSQIITLAIQKGDYERAEEIGRRKKFKNSASIQSQMIKLAIRRGDYERAEGIGKRKKFKNSRAIQSQMITRAIQKGDYEGAEEIGSREEFKDYEPIQSQMIALAIRKRDYERAEEIGSRKEFKNYAHIQSQMITLAIQKGDYERAEEIGKRKAFKKDSIIQLQMKQMKEMRRELLKNNLASIEKKFLNEMKTKLYYDKISQEDIENIKKNANISEYEKTIMLLAIYSKRKDLKIAKQIAKEYKEKSGEVEKNKTINKIIEKMKSKKATIFDMGFYDDILDWEMDEELQITYIEEDKKQEETILPKLEQRDTETVKGKVEKIENSEEKPMKDPINNPTNISKKEKPSNQRKEFISRIDVSPKERETNYYSQIKKYLNKKRKELYVKMQSMNYEERREAIAKYDKIDLLMEKIEENRENKKCLHALHTKILQLKERETDMDRFSKEKVENMLQ